MTAEDQSRQLDAVRLHDIGEKRLLERYILPLTNPGRVPGLPGDDCGVLPTLGQYIYASTDRVPWNLTARRLGLMSLRQLGTYLAVLNISDIAAMGGIPRGMLVNFGLPAEFVVEDLLELIRGIQAACANYNVTLMGGDLSDSTEPSLSATIIGDNGASNPVYRGPIRPGDHVCISGTVGLTPTAFAYFDRLRASHTDISDDWTLLLREHLCNPVAQIGLGRQLAALKCRRAAMDNTDGLGQTAMELAAAAGLGVVLDGAALPTHPASKAMAEAMGIDLATLVLSAGADFKLVACIEDAGSIPKEMIVIGEVVEGPSSVRVDSKVLEIPTGWNYYV